MWWDEKTRLLKSILPWSIIISDLYDIFSAYTHAWGVLKKVKLKILIADVIFSSLVACPTRHYDTAFPEKNVQLSSLASWAL